MLVFSLPSKNRPPEPVHQAKSRSLTQIKSDEELEKSVSAVFQAFGNVYVKIRRDNKGMPFAFCQYEVSRLPWYDIRQRLIYPRTFVMLSALSQWVEG